MAEPRTLLDLGPSGGQHWFASIEDVYEWLSDESGTWSDLIGNGPGKAYNQVTQAFNALHDSVRLAREDDQPVSWLLEYVQQRYGVNGQLIDSGSADAKAIQAISENIGPDEAGFAYAMLKGWARLGDAPNLSYTRAGLRLLLPSLVPIEETQRAFRAERDSFRNAARKLDAAANNSEDYRSEKFGELLDRMPKVLLRQMRRHHAVQSELRATWTAQMVEALASFHATEAAYREHMELAAPVDYWTTKAAGHAKGEKEMLSRVLWYFGVATTLIVASFVGVGWLLLDLGKGTKVDNTVLVVVGAGLAAFTTMLLWGGRLITRLYLSQNHLRHDAEERAVMAKTFLALTAVREADEKDRQIILTALFRPTSDGIVKDDGAPDLGLPGVASKLLGGR